VVEILLAAAVFGFLVTGLIGAIVYGRASSASAGDRTRAVFLAEEGIEATRNIAAASYANLVNGTFGLVQSGNQWTLSGASDVSGLYTRRITIATTGTNRTGVTSTVTWAQPGGTTDSVSLTTQLVNWAVGIKQWSNGIIAGTANTIGNDNAIKAYSVGKYAYVVSNGTSNNLFIADISNPATPVIVSTITIPGTPTDIFVTGNYAYITNISDTAELQVVDVSVPTAPVLKASVNMAGTGNGQGVFVSGNYAYVVRASDATAGANELTVVSVATPTSPVVMGGYSNNIAMNQVYVSGNYAYVATSSTSQEMVVVNVATPSSPVLAATYNPTTAVPALAITGYGTTVLLGMGTTLDAVNISTPSAPTRLGRYTAVSTINDVAIDITNTFAFLGTASSTGEFQVVNVSNPAAITLTKTIDISGSASAIGGVAYNTSLDLVIGASAANKLDINVFTRN